jgi:sugar phosphate isomerase/epimerase
MDPIPSDLPRRAVLAGGLAAVVGGEARAAARPFFARVGLPVGLQLYTLGPDVAKNLEGTLRAVARIGYRTVEFASMSSRTPAQIRAALDAAGLACKSVHVQLAGDLGRLADDLTTLGARYAVAPIPFIPDRLDQRPGSGEHMGDWFRRVVGQMTADDWKWNAEVLNEKAAVLARSGLRVAYHNHNIEFAPVGGTRGLDILIRHTDSKLVSFELDVGWVAAAGVDPLAFLEAHKGRFDPMHLKDIKADTKPNVALTMNPTEVGSGQLPWKSLLPAAYAAGVRNFFVEQEPTFARPRIESAKISYDYLAGLVAP